MLENPKFSLRILTWDEVPLIAPCLRGLAAFHNRLETAFRGLYPVMPIELHLERMREHVVGGSACLVGLFLSDGSPGGFGMASFEGEYGEVDYLFVNEELRERGCGGLIMDRLLAYLEEKKVGIIDVKVVIGNNALEFYERYGFAPRTVVLSKRVRRLASDSGDAAGS